MTGGSVQSQIYFLFRFGPAIRVKHLNKLKHDFNKHRKWIIIEQFIKIFIRAMETLKKRLNQREILGYQIEFIIKLNTSNIAHPFNKSSFSLHMVQKNWYHF